MSHTREPAPRAARRIGGMLLLLVVCATAFAPWLSTGDVARQHPDFALAPPALPSLRSNDGSWHAPFVARRSLVERLPPTYRTLDEPLPLDWFAGSIVRSASPNEPLLPLGSDSLGRDLWTRLLHGGRRSLGLSLAGLIGALLIGTLAGLVAGSTGGWLDTALMRLADLFIAWPALYVILVLRAAMPLAMPPSTLFVLMATVLAVAGWPVVARPVRALTASEREREYVLAATAAGASRTWIIRKHLLPATVPILVTQSLLLAPVFILAEATLSFVGLGFSDPTPSWGTMLAEASNAFTLRNAPWLLSPALAIAMVTLGATLLADRRAR